jgi:Fe-S-cluster containining protein
MMKCRLSKCNAQCCYNLAFENGELERFKDKIVNPVIDIVWFGGVRLTITSTNMDSNKCPFLRRDFKCNIYENRPDVCRKFGEIDKLPCKFMKNKR